TPSAAYWPPPRSRTWSVVGAPSEPRKPPIWMLFVPPGSVRFEERVNVTLKPSMLVELERVIVTGNVALAWVLLNTLEGAPTLTTAWANALPVRARTAARASGRKRAEMAMREHSPCAAKGYPPVGRRRGDTALVM